MDYFDMKPPSDDWELILSIKGNKRWLKGDTLGGYEFDCGKEALLWQEKPRYIDDFDFRVVSFRHFERVKKWLNCKRPTCFKVLLRLVDNSLGLSFASDNAETLIKRSFLGDYGLFSALIRHGWANYYYGFDRGRLDFLLRHYGIDGYKPRSDKLPTKDKVLTIYRGVESEQWLHGFSWSLSPVVASYFAQHHGKEKGLVYRAKVNRKDVVFYENGRWEQEIVTRPVNVFDMVSIPWQWGEKEQAEWAHKAQN